MVNNPVIRRSSNTVFSMTDSSKSSRKNPLHTEKMIKVIGNIITKITFLALISQPESLLIFLLSKYNSYKTKRSRISPKPFCRKGDLNPHEIAFTRTWTVRVCQFRHSCVSPCGFPRNKDILLHPYILVNNFFKFFKNIFSGCITRYPQTIYCFSQNDTTSGALVKELKVAVAFFK